MGGCVGVGGCIISNILIFVTYITLNFKFLRWITFKIFKKFLIFNNIKNYSNFSSYSYLFQVILRILIHYYTVRYLEVSSLITTLIKITTHSWSIKRQQLINVQFKPRIVPLLTTYNSAIYLCDESICDTVNTCTSLRD